VVAFHGPPPAPGAGGGVAPLGGFSGLGNMHRSGPRRDRRPYGDWGAGRAPTPVGEGDDEALDSLLKQEGRGCVLPTFERIQAVSYRIACEWNA
jgi:hypothetical protein